MAVVQPGITTAPAGTGVVYGGRNAIQGLPTWVPAPGGVSVLTRANGRLTNSFIDAATPWFFAASSAKIRNDYSTAVCNPHFGPFGALLFFGSGHAAASDNTLIALVLGEGSCTFRRVINGSPITGSGTDGTTQSNNTLANGYAWATMDWAEATVDGKPAAPHSYGVGDVIGPLQGGAAFGTFIRVLNSAAGYGGDIAAQACHKVDFGGTDGFADGGTPAYAWQRVSRNAGAPVGPAAVGTLGGPNWSAYVASQQRIYYEARAAGSSIAPRWLDLSTNLYVQGTGAARVADAVSPYGETGVMFAVPERNLVVMAYRRTGGVLGIQYLDTTQANPGWVAATVASAPQLLDFAATACWCADNGKIIVGELAVGNTTLCEVSIPSVLSNVWACETYAIPTGIQWVTSSSYKSWTYNSRTKSIVYPGYMSQTGAASEAVYVHRPRGV